MKKESTAGAAAKALTPILILLILILAGALVYLLFGSQIAASLGYGEPANVPEEVVGSSTPNFVPIILPEGEEYGREGETPFTLSGGTDAPSDTPEPAGPAETAPQETAEPTEPAAPPPEIDYRTANALPAGLTLSTEDFTVQVLGQKTTLKVSGGAGSYAWLSQNPAVATVNEKGEVIAVANGTTNILVTDGTKKAVSVVRVRAPSDEFQLNRTDFTRSVGEGTYQLKLTGWDGPVTWTSSNPAAATVSADGTVTPIAPGFATITVAWEGHSRQCFVHVTE